MVERRGEPRGRWGRRRRRNGGWESQGRVGNGCADDMALAASGESESARIVLERAFRGSRNDGMRALALELRRQ